MRGTTADCGHKEHAARERTCLSCDIPVFCRNNYYRGKLLTERDFADEQRYTADKMRLHTRALHGWGVVCGLIVRPHPYCPDKRLVVGSGLALDDCGRGIRLLKEDWVELPQPVKPLAPGTPGYTSQSHGDEGGGKPYSPPPKDPYGQPQKDPYGHRQEDPYGQPPKEPYGQPQKDKYGQPQKDEYGQPRQEPRTEGQDQPYSETEPPERHHGDSGNDRDDDDEGAPLPYNRCDDTPRPQDLYLCIRYAECETEFSPAPFDDCSCTTSSQKPNRICEAYKLELFDTKPDFWDKAQHEPCGYDDCGEYYRVARRHCHGGSEVACLPLAIIHNVVPGEAVTEEQIDNWSERRQLATTETLDQIIRCILTKLPTEELTRIEDTNWEHGRRILCREFMEEYIGTHDRPRGFRIEFSHHVHAGAIDTRSFQALVVFRPENMWDPRHMEVAPAYVDRDEDQTDWCRLRIDPGYARRHLDGRNFDLFLTLKCDVITDRHGHAVDGNYIGRHLPTGDNIQGGTFESWIRVRPRPRVG
jgi:hypothetical protein